MITRGYFIGQIIDELTSITDKIKNRAKLGLTDIHIHLEDFYKDILNITLDLNLKNLNQERMNSPGLDLGDKAKEIAFQITGDKTSAKVNETLGKASSYTTSYKKIRILTLQNKQGSYTIDAELSKPFEFTENDIWDVNDVLNKVMHLELDKLQRLSELISKEVARVTIELEIPDENGKYQTSIDKFIEKIPKERFNGISAYYHFNSTKSEPFDLTEEEVLNDIMLLINTLKKLPRITRQFFSVIYSRGNWKDTEKYINQDYLERICTFPDMEGELRLLDEAGLGWRQEPDDQWQSATFQIRLPRQAKSDYFSLEFSEFIEAKGINLENVLVTLDFSDFE
ncbi:SMEK domain-containing protein [Hafnia sp. CBA7124]|uniref:SMEK domain-containing protein n=1 Tax=Hafnia sp. CBA7124 TaxID=1848580 RepID=UPI000BBA83B6|nr:SMEK domain-containing protein [Hafnia sp. CBA7124]